MTQITLDAKPRPISIDPTKTAVIVVDMQNDFGSKGGMFQRAGIDISGIQKAVAPTAKVIACARRAAMRIVYLKMGYRPDLSDLGAPTHLTESGTWRSLVWASRSKLLMAKRGGSDPRHLGHGHHRLPR